MILLIARRLGSVLLVMLVVAALSFLIFNYLGDPINNILGVNATLDERDELRRTLGLDQPSYVQFWHFLERVVMGDFGISYRNRLPVQELILSRLPATVELVMCATVLALGLGIPMGVYCALRPKGFLSRILQMVSLIGISIPQFLIGMLLILIFSVELRWLSAFGRGEVVQIGWWSTGLLTTTGRLALIMPVITLAVFQISMIMRLVQGEMQEVMRADFIKFARARGLSDRSVHLRHALRNSLLPVVTVVGMQIGSLIAFAIVCEAVFQWPGLGLLILQAIEYADFPVMAAYLALVGFGFAMINLTVDMIYLFIDPQDAPQMTQPTPLMRRVLASDLVWRFRTAPAAVLAAFVLVIMVICAVAAPLIAPHAPFDPGTLNLMEARLPPSWIDGGMATYLFGTDEQGRDVLSTIFYGMRISLAVGVAAVLLSVIIGVTLGLIAGWFGGWIDALIMRMGDVQLSFPSIMIAFFIDGTAKAVMPPDLREDMRFYVVILAIGLADWVQFARTVRAATMIEKKKDYTDAARLSRVPSMKIVFAHILPNTLGPVIILATLGLGVAILTEAILSFLGLGMPPTQPSLGALIRVGNDLLLSGEWWISMFPGLALVFLVLSVNIFGDWLRDALNPRLK